jgi:hypothetical protein
LLKAHQQIHSWVHTKAMVSSLLLLEGEGRDEGGRSPAGSTQFRQSRRDDLTIARSFNCGYLNTNNPSVPTGRLNLADPDCPAVRPCHAESKGKHIAGMAPIIGFAEKFDLPAGCRQHFVTFPGWMLCRICDHLWSISRPILGLKRLSPHLRGFKRTAQQSVPTTRLAALPKPLIN